MGKTCEELLSTCCGVGSNEFVDTFCDACNERASFECADCGEERAAIMKQKQTMKSDLDDILATLNNMTNNTQGFSIDADCDGYQLVRENGAWIVSPDRFLSKRQMYQWISAYIYGIEDGKKILKRYELDRMLEKMGANK